MATQFSVTAKESAKYSGCYVPSILITEDSKHYPQGVRTTLTLKQSPSFLGFHNYDDALNFGRKAAEEFRLIGCYDENVWTNAPASWNQAA